MHHVTISPGFGENSEHWEFSDLEALAAFVVSMLNDEFTENLKPNETAQRLYAAIAALYSGLASGEAFCFMFDGESYFVQPGVGHD